MGFRSRINREDLIISLDIKKFNFEISLIMDCFYGFGKFFIVFLFLRGFCVDVKGFFILFFIISDFLRRRCYYLGKCFGCLFRLRGVVWSW